MLRTRDLVLFTTSGIIGIDTIATSATNGVQAIFWILFSCILFAVPYAFIAAEMGSIYVKNGGTYVWIKEASTIAIAYLPVLMYQWQGFELQSNAAQEMSNPKRDVPIAVLWSVILFALGHTLGMLGLLLVLPLNKLSNVSGLFDAFKAILPGLWLLGPIAVMIVVGLLASGTTWLLGVDRAFVASGYDGNIPKWLGHFHPQFGTPNRVAVIGALLSSLILGLNVFGNGSGLGAVYQILLNMSVLAGTAPYLFMCPALLIFRKRYPNIERPFQVPGGQSGAWAVVVIGLAWMIPTLVFVYVPSASVANKPLYLTELVAGTIIAILVASLLYWADRVRRRTAAVSGWIATQWSAESLMGDTSESCVNLDIILSSRNASDCTSLRTAGVWIAMSAEPCETPRMTSDPMA